MLTWSLWSVIRPRMLLAGVVKLLNSSVQFLYPLLLNQILLFIQTVETSELWKGYTFAVAFGLAMIAKAVLEGVYFFLTFRSGWQVRSIMTTEIYQKALRLSPSARQSQTVGQIVNLMQLDSTKLEMFVAMAFHVLWDGVYQIIGYMVILYTFIGWAAFVGLAVMLVAIPVQGLVFAKVLALNKKMVGITDDRVKLTNEVLQGMMGIKMAAWENKYSEVISGYRAKEIKLLRSTMFLTAFSSAYMMAMPAITAVVALSVYAVNVDGNIDAATLFTALSAFGQLRFPLMFYPNALNQLVQARVSRKRIADFFALDEVVQKSKGNRRVEDDDADDAGSDVMVEINDGVFYWKRPSYNAARLDLGADGKGANPVSMAALNAQGEGEETWPDEDIESGENEVERAALRDINVTVKRGKLVGIIGSVGSGKSSLIGAMINELFCAHGSVTLRGSVAYAAQSAWILNDTVRENILYGEPFDEKRYFEVLKVCQLMHDLEVLDDGDQTVIGERGINLSGGQKQRISVARAVYSTRDIVILDDPLSALDPEVARKMFEDCILKFLKGRTRILVTNQLNFLPQCDKIIVLDSKENMPGEIVEQGRYSKLVTSGLDFSRLMEKYNGKEDEDERLAESELSLNAAKDREEEDAESLASERLVSSLLGPREGSSSVAKAGIQETEGKQLMQVEERQKGAVQFSEYVGYIKSGGGYLFFIFVLFLYVLSQVGTVANTAWVSIWADDNNYEDYSLGFYLAGYALTAILLAVITYMRSVAIFYLGVRASAKLHKELIRSITHAPMRFFDTTPIGRVISRFSKDLFLIDTQLPFMFSFFLFTTMFVFFSFGTIGFTTPLFLAAIPVMVIIYMYILNYYRPLARDSKRLESISRSPVYAHFSETLGGLSTIRAFGNSGAFKAANAEKVDENLKGWYLVKAIERWLSVRLEILGAMITILAACLAVYGASEGTITAGLAGLSLTFSISITGLLNQTVRTFAELEAGMNSVERVLFYSKEIEQEKAFDSPNPPPEDWPSRGALEIRNLRMRYREDTELVLKGLTVSIEGGQRVGIAGRTGSGKSSTLSALLRLVEPEMDDPEGPGPITIDGVDISKIGLHELRSKISIVPQNPVIFSGTVRSNLDPFNAYEDDQIWDALQQCAMVESIRESGGLDSEVSEFGENFSQGQRQLLCLARAVLAQAKILLLDEATSSVDYETDAAIQNTINSSFKGSTILTIAHRMLSIIEYDRILVLSDGQVAEFGSPDELLKDSDSEFSGMVGELGSDMAGQLKTLARKAAAARSE
ncbi:Multidrug resistance-associated protein 1 (ATP-binding cassette sub-family C member 1) (Glutathione-S-conjugate-translocating ATPase ABCC1) (Leukotriene C(4) transporter) (LTC4 transporter) [Durusdinium trenchii]|uniref:Multidrug resistance-associated protein 1 (ATP-binding cassette sub-family C member 1) (Glutathione-S-conjugate-translocating ATPase ABCC1) (Leukotriene C(4) transporter) (LTC4 transporter) n=1 Tax=Durusdinium trenchii TaxID=1381693 RepID=A0ABP0IQR2_9DINO